MISKITYTTGRMSSVWETHWIINVFSSSLRSQNQLVFSDLEARLGNELLPDVGQEGGDVIGLVEPIVQIPQALQHWVARHD